MDFSAASDNDFKEKDPYLRNFFHESYLLNHPENLQDPALSPAYATSSTLPPVVGLFVAEIDPNVRDMKAFINRLSLERPDNNGFIAKIYQGAFHKIGRAHV